VSEGIEREFNPFNFRGLNTALLPDVMPPGKFPVAYNIRADGDTAVCTRPGATRSFVTGSNPPTDIRAYTTLGTDNQPRIIVHDSGGGVWLDDGVKKGQVGTGGTGASLIPYRPNQSPQSWMYICNPTGYKKFSAPDSSNVVTVQNVGIAEPQAAPDACPDGFQYNEFTSTHGSWTQGGTAGAPSDATRSTDTVTAIFQDPASISPATKTRYSVQIATTVQYQAGETLTFNKSGGGTFLAVIEDVLPPINGGTALTIQAIRYTAGLTGACIIVPSQLSTEGNAYAQIAGLRRGALIKVNAEVVLVLSVTVGPQGQVAIEASTTGAHAAGDTIIGIPAIICAGISSLVVGQTVTAAEIDSALTTGIATLTQTLSTNPFNLSLGTKGTPQQDDYIHCSLKIDAPANLTEIKVLFDVGDGSFTQNFLYYAVEPSSLINAIANTATQQATILVDSQNALVQSLAGTINPATGRVNTATDIQNVINQLLQQINPATGQPYTLTEIEDLLQPTGRLRYLSTNIRPTGSPGASGFATTGASQWTEIMFPITGLTRVGNDQTKTLANCGKVQILVNCAGAIAFAFGSLWVGGGGQPDVGTQGAPYFYRVRPRSVLTGAPGNPSPSTRYGILPRRQSVIVSLPSAAYDSQIDTWDIFRFGGTVNAWQRVGSTSAASSTFVDNVFDDAVRGGSLLEFDNFEPWPSVDQPWTATVGSGGIASVTVYGIEILVYGSTFPSTITRWLPGTLITLNGQLTYTLWNRPIAIAGGYIFTLLENAGSPTVTTLSVAEPNVARQVVPYLFGPDASGVVYAVGDALRPGVVYSAKPNAPDATPNNIYDLNPPSEPLMGGEVIDGVALLASSKRWWVIQYVGAFKIRPNETPAGRGLAAPYGHCTDGKYCYFWAKDGILRMVPGAPATSLTDPDLSNLFPTEGAEGTIAGRDVAYGPYTFYAPDYSRVASFRLSVVNSILRAHYIDQYGNLRILLLDMTLGSDGNPRMAWSTDVYPFSVVNSYQPEQPPGTLLTEVSAYPETYFLGSNGVVYTEAADQNDDGTPIPCAIATRESNSTDSRQAKEWVDGFLDSVPQNGITVTPMSDGRAAAAVNNVAASAARTKTILSVGGSVYLNYLGFLLEWTDDFSL
jgi:hypothetical protein